jgi:hypothetical protein
MVIFDTRTNVYLLHPKKIFLVKYSKSKRAIIPSKMVLLHCHYDMQIPDMVMSMHAKF